MAEGKRNPCDRLEISIPSDHDEDEFNEILERNIKRYKDILRELAKY